MSTLSREQAASREKTLLVALLLSMWAPLVTGIAVLLSHSSTQLADFIRRSVELIALFISWRVFRHVQRGKGADPAAEARLERLAGYSVAVALTLSGLVMLGITVSRFSTFEPGGNVYPGLVIATLGLFTNSWFWRRYTRMTRESYNPVIDAQRYLYRAKSVVDLCVIVALAAVAVSPHHPATSYIDALGSAAVACYLVWSGLSSARTAAAVNRESFNCEVKVMAEIVELEGEIWQVDLEERGIPGCTAGYFVKGDSDWMLVETGPATSADKILAAAASLGIEHERVRHIAVTHIHIDHAGGLGTVARHFKEARIWVQPAGLRHMIDPSRLREGSRAFYGAAKMQEFGEILPVPAERIEPAEEGRVIELGGRTLEVWETPGHARHHASYYDHKTRGLFSGDGAGMYFPRLSRLLGRPVIRPATPPPDFRGSLMLDAMCKMALHQLDRIYFTHFGAAAPPQQLLEMVMGQLCVYMHLAKEYKQGPDARQKLGLLLRGQMEKGLGGDLSALWNHPDQAVQSELRTLLDAAPDLAAGQLNYLEKIKQEG